MFDWNGPFARIRTLLTRHRRLVGALLAGATVLILIETLAPAPAAGRSVVVAAHALGSGAMVGRADLRVVVMPPGVAPARAFGATGPVVGRRLAGPVSTGEPIVPERLVDPSMLTGLAHGMLAVVVPVRDAAQVGLLAIGDRVDVFAPGAESAMGAGGATGGAAAAGTLPLGVPLLIDAPVLAIPPGDDSGALGATTTAASVVLAATRDQAAVLATATAVTPLFIALVR